MEVRLTPAIEQVIPPQISFNFEEIKSELAGKLMSKRQQQMEIPPSLSETWCSRAAICSAASMRPRSMRS